MSETFFTVQLKKSDTNHSYNYKCLQTRDSHKNMNLNNNLRQIQLLFKLQINQKEFNIIEEVIFLKVILLLVSNQYISRPTKC